MALTLFAHPFSSYCQKVLTALYESDVAFEYRSLEDPAAGAEMRALWPFGKFPVLVDDGETVAESTAIIEHLDRRHPGPARLIPADPEAALRVRFLDRVFDNHVMTPMQKPVAESLRPDPTRLDETLEDSRRKLDVAYAWLNDALVGDAWAAGDAFTLADCAAAPALFYADWVHPVAERYGRLRDYRARLLERPSFARCVEEARPFRGYFPLGAPDRD